MSVARHVFAAMLCLAAAASAQEAKLGAITVTGAQARATVPGQKAGGAFLRLQNEGSAADRLIAASSPVSGRVELHTMRLEGDVMRMRQIDAIELPAGGQVELKPGGMHLMLMELKSPLKPGDTVPLTLRFEKAGEVTLDMPVRPFNSSGAAGSQHDKPHGSQHGRPHGHQGGHGH